MRKYPTPYILPAGTLSRAGISVSYERFNPFYRFGTEVPLREVKWPKPLPEEKPAQS